MHTATAALTIAFFVNPVFTGRPILARLLARSSVVSDWTAVAAVLAGVIYWRIAGGPAAGWVIAVIMAALTVVHALRAIPTLWAEGLRPSSGPR